MEAGLQPCIPPLTLRWVIPPSRASRTCSPPRNANPHPLARDPYLTHLIENNMKCHHFACPPPDTILKCIQICIPPDQTLYYYRPEDHPLPLQPCIIGNAIAHAGKSYYCLFRTYMQENEALVSINNALTQTIVQLKYSPINLRTSSSFYQTRLKDTKELPQSLFSFSSSKPRGPLIKEMW